jgi:hypothetical protein
MFSRWFCDQGIRKGALSRLGVDISLIGLALLPFDAAVSVILVPLGVVLTFAGLPAVMHGLGSPQASPGDVPGAAAASLK